MFLIRRVCFPVLAAKVTVKRKTVGSCNTTYGVTVIDSYLPCPNSTIPQLPLYEATITTYTQPCSSCFNLTVGQTYWVGGIYYVNCRGQPVWEIPRIKGAASLWTTKYDQKGPTWVQTARREHGCWPVAIVMTRVLWMFIIVVFVWPLLF